MESIYKDIDYLPVDDGQHIEGERSPPPPLPGHADRRRTILSFLAGCILSLVVLTVGAAALLQPSSSSRLGSDAEDARGFVDAEWNDCGRSSEVAIARGCVMEPLFYGWFPKQCVYEELNERFRVFDDRKYFFDANLTLEVPPEELWAGKHNPVWTRKYHGEHCLYQWRKLQYAVDHREEYVDPKTISMAHENHCADQLSEGCEDQYSRSMVELGFYRCKRAFWAKEKK